MAFPRFLLLLVTLFAFFSGNYSPLHAQNALDFDGIDDRATALNASSLVTNSSMSMAMWVYPTNPAASWPNFDGFAGFRNEFSADFYMLQLSSTTLEVRFRNSSNQVFTMAYPGLNLNTWNHFVATVDGSFLRLYQNGVIADSIPCSGVFTTSASNFYLGTLPFQSTNFDLDGRLDDVCLWNRALSASDVNAWYNACGPDLNDPGLQLCYEFNQGVGGGNNGGITSVVDGKGNINAGMTGFTLNGNTSNFITFGNPTLTNVIDSAACSYTSPSGNYIWDSSGVYLDTLTNSVGCDSIISTNLIITGGITGDSITVDECEDYTSPNGNVYTSSGVYLDTLMSMAGCDSIITIDLTVNQNSNAVLTETACGSYTSPGGLIFSASGTYADTISNAVGCDSILTINLTVNQADTSVSVTGSNLTANATNATFQWLNCDNNFTPIPGQTNATFIAASDGNYAVEVTQNGCTDTSACINVVLIGAPEPFGGPVQVHPNPNQGQFSIQLPGVFQEVEARITDPTGKLISRYSFYRTQELKLALDAPQGIYLVELTADGERKVVKIVKQ